MLLLLQLHAINKAKVIYYTERLISSHIYYSSMWEGEVGRKYPCLYIELLLIILHNVITEELCLISVQQQFILINIYTLIMKSTNTALL